MTSNENASGSTDGTPTISNRSTYPYDNRRSQMANLDPLLERNRVFATAGAYAGLSILPSQPAGSRPRVCTRPVPSLRPATNHRGRRCDMHARTRLVLTQPTGSDARCEALFASALQPSDTPTADPIARAIGFARQRFGARGCAGRMAQEFGDHPDAAAQRMRWARQLAA